MTKSLPLVLTSSRKSMPARHWIDMTVSQQEEALKEIGLPRYRVQQVNKQYFHRFCSNAETMSDIPLKYRREISENFFPPLLSAVRSVSVDDGDTIKTLWRLSDGSLLESVVMYYRDRVTLCVSSQAGCGMACPFCATGQGGLQRNLSSAEIVEQIRLAALMVSQRSHGKRRLSHLVFMGMGEPLANYQRVIHAIRWAISAQGFRMSPRNIVLSTVGIVPRIKRLTVEDLPITLAVSLHAPDDELRDTLVPINTRWGLDEVFAAMREYAYTTSRRVSVEYALIRDVNDHRWRGDLLGERLRENLGKLAHVNVIPLNPTPRSKWDASDPEVMKAFVTAVKSHGISCTVRNTRGKEIAAACGQLAAEDLLNCGG